MKLAILGSRGVPARHGGFETFAEEISIRLAAAGHEITVMCPADSDTPDSVYHGVKLKYVTIPHIGVFSQIVWDAKCFALSAGEYDVVYMLGTGGSFAAWIPRLFGSKVWINNDGIEYRRKKWNLWGRAYLRLSEALAALFSSRVIADSQAIGYYLKHRYKGLVRTSTIAYGAYPVTQKANPELLSRWSLKTGRYYLVVCRLEPENHLLEIIEGFEKSASPCPMVIVGNISDPNRYVRKLLEHQGRRIRFLGTVYDRELLTVLRSHVRAYIHGHCVGGTNPSLLEAMACANLIIAHDNVFNREVLADTGMFFKDQSELASDIDQIDSGVVDIETLRNGALQRIRSSYTWDHIADLYLELLRRQ